MSSSRVGTLVATAIVLASVLIFVPTSVFAQARWHALVNELELTLTKNLKDANITLTAEQLEKIKQLSANLGTTLETQAPATPVSETIAKTVVAQLPSIVPAAAPAQVQAASEAVKAQVEDPKCIPNQPKPSLLRREVIELSLSSSPAARFSCTLTAYREDHAAHASASGQAPPFDALAESKTIVWDATSNLPLTRRIRVRGNAEWAVQCGSETWSLAERPDPTKPEVANSLYSYRLWMPVKPCDNDLVRADGARTLNAYRTAPSCNGGPQCNANGSKTYSRADYFILPEKIPSTIATLPTATSVAKSNHLALSVSIRPLDEFPLTAGDNGTTIASTRSLVSFDDVVKDLATTVAEVALRRAKANATAFIQDKLAEVFCTELTYERLRTQVRGKRLEAWLTGTGTGVVTSGPLLPQTCQAARGVRVAEMAATGTAIRRAVTSDLAALSFSTLLVVPEGVSLPANVTERVESVRHAIRLVSSLVASVMVSRVDVTDRQAQAMLLFLATPDGSVKGLHGDWRDPLLLGTAVLTECLEQGECSADQLQRFLLEELSTIPALSDPQCTSAAGRDPRCGLKERFEFWDALPRLLLGIRDVLRPTPGTPPRETAGRALGIALDVLEVAVKGGWNDILAEEQRTLEAAIAPQLNAGVTISLQRWAAARESITVPRFGAKGSDPCISDSQLKEHPETLRVIRDDLAAPPTIAMCQKIRKLLEIGEEVGSASFSRERFRLLRSLVNASIEEKYGTAIQLAGSLIADLIRDDCPDNGPCGVAVSSATAEKWFGVLGAFGAYAASYDAKPEGDATAEEVDAYQAEQRREAMDDLVDAATDRRGRGHNHVFSVGVAVGASVARRFQQTTSGGHERRGMQGLSLPTGFAYDFLPGGYGKLGVFGFHLQATFLDLGQFLVASASEIAQPNAATPVYIGLQPALLIGDPKYNVMLGADWGYAPGMDFREDNVDRGGFRFGLFAGMYIPFLDFN